MRKLTFVAVALFVVVATLPAEQSGDSYSPKRVNKVIELFEAGQPAYYA